MPVVKKKNDVTSSGECCGQKGTKTKQQQKRESNTHTHTHKKKEKRVPLSTFKRRTNATANYTHLHTFKTNKTYKQGVR